MVSIILIAVTFIAAVLILLFVKPDPKIKATKTQANVINNYIDRYNELVRQYNHTNDTYLIEAQKLERKIVLCNDFEAQSKFESIALNYERACNVANDYLKRACICLDSKDFAGATYCMDELERSINEMDDIVSSFHNVAPKMAFNEKYYEEQSQQQESSFQFFIGCKTKDEADVRYRSLAKAFHPDSKGGDASLFLRMQKEYESLRWET